jgi:hypothetical protein
VSRDDCQPISNAELEAFTEVSGELGERVTEFLAEGTDRTPEEIEAAVDELPKPVPFDDEPVDA